MQFRFVGRHPETLGEGLTVAPGDIVDIDPTYEVNDRLIREEQLVAIAAAKPRRQVPDEEAKA